MPDINLADNKSNRPEDLGGPKAQYITRVKDNNKKKNTIMKKLFLSMAMVLSAMATFAQSQDPMDKFQAFAQNLDGTVGVAFLEVDSEPVMLVTRDTVGVADSNKLNALSATVYGLDDNGYVVNLGNVTSEGKVFPLSVYKDKLVTADGETVSVYDINELTGKIAATTNHSTYNPDLLYVQLAKSKPVLFTLR